jgi:hypothetical protein
VEVLVRTNRSAVSPGPWIQCHTQR